MWGFQLETSSDTGEPVTALNSLSLTQQSWVGTLFLVSRRSYFYCFSNQCNTMPRRGRKMVFKGTVFYLRMLSLKPGAINDQAVFCLAGRGLDFFFLKFKCFWFCFLVSTDPAVSYCFPLAHSHVCSTSPAPVGIWVCDSWFKLLPSQLYKRQL